MKHGRRHKTLKEKTYRDRAAQDAPGYKRPYDAIDVREPGKPGAPPPPAATAIGSRVKGKTAHALRRLGVDPRDDESEAGPETAK